MKKKLALCFICAVALIAGLLFNYSGFLGKTQNHSLSFAEMNKIALAQAEGSGGGSSGCTANTWSTCYLWLPNCLCYSFMTDFRPI